MSWHLIRLEASITLCMAQIDITMYYYIPYYAEKLARWHFLIAEMKGEGV